MKKRQTAKFRVAIGQVGLLVSLLLVALLFGLVPDRKGAVREGRAALAESVAIHVTRQVAKIDLHEMKADLQLVVDRNKDLLSAAIRQGDSRYFVVVGDHNKHWQPMSDELSFDSQVLVPVFAGKKKWGQLELRFASTSGLFGLEFSQAQIIPLIIFLSASSFLVFYLYLGKMLKHLDPSRAIPQRVRSALDTMAEGLLVVDNRGQIVLANGAIAAILGKDVDEMLGWKAHDLGWEIGDGTSKSVSVPPWTACLKTGEPQRNSVVRLRDHQNEVRTFMVNCSPVMANGGKMGGALISFDDVTQLENKKKELGLAKEAAESANKSKSEFLANMSHEIRTPMNAILGFTDVLRRGYDLGEEDPMQHLNTIHSSGTHLLDLINDILDLSKVESGQLDIENIACSPHLIAREVTRVLAVKAKDKGITLGLEIDGLIPESIMSDPSRLRQVVMNLVGNAIKFTEVGGVKIVLGLIPGEEPQLRIEVCDSGIGMTREQMERIFDPFSQADSSVTRRFGGTGLGLTISRRYAEALGGSIGVASEPGAGSVFTVMVSTGSLDGVAMHGAGHHEAIVERPVVQKGQWQFRQQRVLVVDDGKENRDLVTLVLRKAGLQVECAENGKVGVDMAMGSPFDLILMDMQMPVMDGHTATRLLREQGMATPIYALTAHAMKGFERECEAAGCTGYLTKPIDIDLLLDTLAGELEADKVTPTPLVQKRLPVHAHRSASALPPIASSLPMEYPEFREIVLAFLPRLQLKLDEMYLACDRGDFRQLAEHAHWLKGSGGTVGFPQFTEPARVLEELARDANDVNKIKNLLDELRDLSFRIEIADYPSMESMSSV